MKLDLNVNLVPFGIIRCVSSLLEDKSWNGMKFFGLPALPGLYFRARGRVGNLGKLGGVKAFKHCLKYNMDFV